MCKNALRMLLFIGVLEWLSDIQQNQIGDTWHDLTEGVLKLFSPRHITSFDWPKCLNFQDDTCQHSIGLLVSLSTRVNV